MENAAQLALPPQSLDCARNALMLAAICATLPATVYQLGKLLEESRILRARLIKQGLYIGAAVFVLALVDAIIGLYSPAVAGTLFVVTCIAVCLALAFFLVIISVVKYRSEDFLPPGSNPLQP